MYWPTLIHNIGLLFGFSDSVAGTILSFIIASAVTIGVYIMSVGNGNPHRTNSWMSISFIISLIMFTYPFQWIPVWYGLVMILVFSVVLGYALSKTGRSVEG
jgi:hypothetical protein